MEGDEGRVLGTLHSGGEAECADPHTTRLCIPWGTCPVRICQSPQPCTHACPPGPDMEEVSKGLPLKMKSRPKEEQSDSLPPPLG